MLQKLVLAQVAALLSTVAAVGDKRTFAVMHFEGGPLVEGRTDPIVSPNAASGHVHTVMGSNAFHNGVTGEQLMKSTCTNAKLQADKSAYWMPKVYFQDKAKGTLEPVKLYYMNVYYFFDATNDKVVSFPVGLQMVSGDANRRAPPKTGNSILVNGGTQEIQPAQFTCPRQNYNVPSYPANSDGTKSGLPDTGNLGAGAGFPDQNCDGTYSPLRADLHFPSCYDPSKALDDYRNNMVWPTDNNGKQDCPKGFIHVPHLFYEMYWDTEPFAKRWTPGQGNQPFVLANGDSSGYSLHGDFIAAWDTKVLQTVIDGCDAGQAGFDKCPGNIGQITPGGTTCKIANPVPEQIDGVLKSLPGNNPLFGYGVLGGGANPPPTSTRTTARPTSSTRPTSTAKTTMTTVKTTSTARPSPTGTTLPDISSFKYVGCFGDKFDARALTGIIFANPGGAISMTKCVNYCAAQGFSLAGTEYAGQCFCGNALNPRTPIDESKCNMKCEGDSAETCGGPDALSVYSKTGKAKRRSSMWRFL